jgi:putative ABC transport system permease protein
VLAHYLLTALRSFRRRWVTASINVAGLALGLACFIGTLGYFEYIAADDTQYPDAKRTYYISSQMVAPGIDITSAVTEWTVGDYVRAELNEADLVARATHKELQAISVEGQTLEAYLSFVDPEFLQLFPQKFRAGAAATSLAGPGKVVLTRELAQRLFHTEHAVGKTLVVGGVNVLTVGGVIDSPSQPSHFGTTASNELRFDMLASSATLPAVLTRRGGEKFADEQLHDPVYGLGALTYVRLRAGVRPDLVREYFSTLGQRHQMSSMERNIRLLPIGELRGSRTQYDLRQGVLSMLLATFVLAVSALNYANLTAAIAVTQRREIGVRCVLGATRGQIVTQLLMDAALAITLAALLSFTLIAALNPALGGHFDVDLTYAWEHRPFWAMLLPTLAGLALVLCMYPALVLSRLRIATSLQQSRGNAIRLGAARWLVSVQFLLASLLLLTVVVIRSQVAESARRASAMVSHPVVVIENDLEAAGVNFEVLRHALLEHRSVESVAAADRMPFAASFGVSYYVRRLDGTQRIVGLLNHGVTDDYFSVLGIPVLAGKLPRDVPEKRGVVLGRSAAAGLGWTPEGAIGQELFGGHVTAAGVQADAAATHVVGVVEDKVLQTTRIEAARSASYANILEDGRKIPLIRLASPDLAGGRVDVEAVWRTVAPQTVPHVRFLDEEVEAFLAGDRLREAMLASLTMMTLAIALVGLVAISVQTADRRRFEVGIRKTLGARTLQVLTLLLRELSVPIVAGNLVAWPIAYWVTNRYVQDFVYRQPLTLGLCVVSLLLAVGVGWLFAGWSVLRAARVSPAVVLRDE